MKALKLGLTITTAMNLCLPAMADSNGVNIVTGLTAMTGGTGAAILFNNSAKTMSRTALKARIQEIDQEIRKIEDAQITSNLKEIQSTGSYTGKTVTDQLVDSFVNNNINKMQSDAIQSGRQLQYSIELEVQVKAFIPIGAKELASVANQEGISLEEAGKRLIPRSQNISTFKFLDKEHFENFLRQSREGATRLREIQIKSIKFNQWDIRMVEYSTGKLQFEKAHLNEKLYGYGAELRNSADSASLKSVEELEKSAKFMSRTSKALAGAGALMGGYFIVQGLSGSAHASEQVDDNSDPGLALALKNFKENNQAKLNTGTGQGVAASE